MALQAYIENLRNKPPHHRKRIAFWTSFGITAVIFVFWLASFMSLGAPAKTAIADEVSAANTPAQSLTASVGSFFGDVWDMVFTPKTVTYADIEVAPGKK